MENENKLVVLSQKNLLAKVNSSIGITNKLIAENNKKLVAEIFERNPKFFISLISQFYPLNVEMVAYEKHLNWNTISLYNDLTFLLINSNPEDFDGVKSFNWKQLSSNRKIEWSSKIIDKFIDKWNWHELLYNKVFPWNIELVEKYEHKLDFQIVESHANSSVPLSINLIEKYKNDWDDIAWCLISSYNSYITWNEVFLFKDYFSWEYLSENESLIWTLELIEQYEDKWNWSSLSANKNLTWSLELINQYEDRWSWSSLSANRNLPWSLELLEKYEQRWDWNNISNNQSIEWTAKLIERFDHKLYFDTILNDNQINEGKYWHQKSNYGLSSNKNVCLTEELIEKYIDRWNWSILSENEKLPWSVDFFNKYIGRWDWHKLSGNNKFPFTEVIISTYEERWQWIVSTPKPYYEGYLYDLDLSSNEHLPWSESFIDKYAERWNWSNLFDNMGINWSVKLLHKHSDKLICSNNDSPSSIWNTLSPYIDDELVINLLEDIKNGKIEINN